MNLKAVEEAKIKCARKLFAVLNRKNAETVKYDVVTNYANLMQLVGVGS